MNNATHAIPIENIYYLFCYAWDRFEEAESIPLGATPSPDLPNLLARVMLSEMRSLLRRGLYRSYELAERELATVRGRIDMGRSMRLSARGVRRLDCEFDEFTSDIALNRILKASLLRLARAPKLDPEVANELRALAHAFRHVADVSLEDTSFARVQLHRNNACYEFLLKVAELAYDCLLPHPSGDGFLFQDVLRDERKMARVFEKFVRNFYRVEQREFRVEPLAIKWDAVGTTDRSISLLPEMVVDVFLRNRQRRILIDTKYYSSALQSNRGSHKLHSANLYQLFSYLKNAASDSTFEKAEGMLLYPTAQHSLDASYFIQGHRVTVATIDLSQRWPVISDRLVQLLLPR